jgi:hypothetical protein
VIHVDPNRCATSLEIRDSYLQEVLVLVLGKMPSFASVIVVVVVVVVALLGMMIVLKQGIKER